MKSLFKTLATLSLAAALPLTLAACGSDSGGEGTDEATADTSPLRVGMEAGYAPFNWTQKDDSNNAAPIDGGGWAGGYDVAIAQAVAHYMGREIVVVKMDWDGLIPALTTGQIDMIVAGMSPTDERREAIDFSDPYYTSDAVIVVRGDSEYAQATSLEDFAGAKITAQLGTIHYPLVEQIPGVDQQTAMDSFPTMVIAVKSGKIDGYISERPGALSAVAANPELSFVAFEQGQGFDVDQNEIAISVGVKQGSELTEQINQALASISLDQRAQMMDQAIANQPEG
ncbi:MAG: transporter substrate-binding domain-containing protein [Micrococcales bacterium]|nr:transporter substrate-binding domain-containing protein [Micrococcales bacterium]